MDTALHTVSVRVSVRVRVRDKVSVRVRVYGMVPFRTVRVRRHGIAQC